MYNEKPCPFCAAEPRDDSISYDNSMSKKCWKCGVEVKYGWDNRPLENTLRARAEAAEMLLREAIGEAAFCSCMYQDAEIANATWHCCDWSEWAAKVAKLLDIELTE